MENIIKVGIGVYIFNEKRQVLLGLRKSPHGQGTWCPPGGHLEFGESFEQGAIREAKEETNLDIMPKDLKLSGTTNDFFEETGKHYITIHMSCSNHSSTVELMEPNKCEKWTWFDLDKLPNNLFLSNKNFLKIHKL